MNSKFFNSYSFINLEYSTLFKISRIRNCSIPQNIKTTKFGPKKFLKINDYEKPTKMKKKVNISKPFPSFSFFRPLLSLLPKP